jgi:hypothetical protein
MLDIIFRDAIFIFEAHNTTSSVNIFSFNSSVPTSAVYTTLLRKLRIHIICFVNASKSNVRFPLTVAIVYQCNAIRSTKILWASKQLPFHIKPVYYFLLYSASLWRILISSALRLISFIYFVCELRLLCVRHNVYTFCIHLIAFGLRSVWIQHGSTKCDDVTGGCRTSNSLHIKLLRTPVFSRIDVSYSVFTLCVFIRYYINTWSPFLPLLAEQN